MFGLDQTLHPAIIKYKQEPDSKEYITLLWQHWAQRFGICPTDILLHDGALDALVCATVAYLFHRDPARLVKLKHTARDKTGYGPFYVVAPVSS